MFTLPYFRRNTWWLWVGYFFSLLTFFTGHWRGWHHPGVTALTILYAIALYLKIALNIRADYLKESVDRSEQEYLNRHNP